MSQAASQSMPAAQAPPTACWAQVGVYGDSSCPELQRFVHCRNCSVYSAAGLDLLNRPIPAGYQHELTHECGRPRQVRQSSRNSAVAFRVSAEWLALPTPALLEIAEYRPIRSLPHRRQGIFLGLANIRGEVTLCVSLGHFLGLEKLPSRESLRRAYHRLLLITHEGQRLAFPVDEVHGPVHLLPEQLLPPPATIARSVRSYTQSLFRSEQHLIGLLAPRPLFEALNRSFT